MLDFLAQNYGSIIAGAVVIAVLTLAAVKVVGDKRAGKGGCGGNCAECHGCSERSPKGGNNRFRSR